MRFFITLFLLASAVLMPAFSRSEETAPIKSEGMAARDDKADVKKKALDQAFKKAVIQALEDLMKKESVAAGPEAVDSAVSANPRSYITNYRILAEGWVTHTEGTGLSEAAPEQSASGASGAEFYHIWIEASVDQKELRGVVARLLSAKDLDSYPITVSMLDITDYGSYRSLLAALRRIPLIKEVSYGSFYRGRIVVSVKSTVGAQALMERIAREVAEGYSVIPGGGENIIIKPAAPRPAMTR